jgi:hypothetical protein
MKSMFGSGKVVLAFWLVCLASMVPAAHGQARPSKQPEQEKLIAAAREIMTTARYCA